MKGNKLKNPYVSIQTENGKSFGGNQDWFPYSYLKQVGCGVIGAADLVLYLKNEIFLTKEQYLEAASRLWKQYIPVIPGFGINGLMLVVGINFCFRKERLPFFASWQFYGRKTYRMIDRMLADDFPVILAVGPNFPKIWKKEKLKLYAKKADGSFYASSSARAHYVTVTGREGRKWQISSWGREYFVDIKEYEHYVRKNSSPLVCGIVRIHKLKK